MPRRSPNREDGEAGAEDRLRRFEQVMKYIIIFVVSLTCIAVFGMCVEYFVLEDKTQFNTDSLLVGICGVSSIIIGLFLYAWLSKPRFRRELRVHYRNFRRTCRVFIPAFCARHQRRIHPQPRVMVNTISVRPQPTPPYAVADCSVQIETPPPIRPFTPTPPEHSDIGTVSFSNFEDSLPNLNAVHQD